MLKNKYLFILGAGASMPYGFPSGAKLVDDIWRTLNDKGAPAYNGLLSVIKDKTVLDNFRDFLRYSSIPSIDMFLSFHSDSKQFRDIGKYLIVREINKKENEVELFRREEYENGKYGKKWYHYLFGKIINTIKKEKINEFLMSNKIKFITFNYDRSLDWFLYKAFKHSFYNFFKDEKNKIILSDFIKNNILHVHGKISEIFNGSELIEDSYSIILTKIYDLRNNIQIIDEKHNFDSNKEIEQFLEGNNTTIVFLGFGYNQDNLNKLFDLNYFRKYGDINVLGTMYGLSKAERKMIYGYFPSLNTDIRNRNSLGLYELEKIAIEKYDCLDFMREFVTIY